MESLSALHRDLRADINPSLDDLHPFCYTDIPDFTTLDAGIESAIKGKAALLDDDTLWVYNGTSWVKVGGGEVSGPASATDEVIASFDGTSGKLIKESFLKALNASYTLSRNELSFLEEPRIVFGNGSNSFMELYAGLYGATPGNPGYISVNLAGNGPFVVNLEDGNFDVNPIGVPGAQLSYYKVDEGTFDVYNLKLVNGSLHLTPIDAAPAAPGTDEGKLYTRDAQPNKLFFMGQNGTEVDLTSGVDPLTTKGDLYTYSTVKDRLPVGANDSVLFPDSSTSTGLKWSLPYTAYDVLSIHGADIASAGTVNLETATGNLVDITGTTTITAITLSEGHERTVRFTGALTLTHGASLVLPTGANITTAAGDFAIFRGYAGGVVRCVFYSPATGQPLTTVSLAKGGTGQVTAYASYDALSIHGADVASAGTLNLDTATGNLVDVTGTTTITAITLAEGRERVIRFTGALTLTNGASLVLPGGANITTAAGDFAVVRGYAAGVVRVVYYSPATGYPIVTVPVSKGGTGLTALGTAEHVLHVNAAGSALEFCPNFRLMDGGSGSTVLKNDGGGEFRLRDNSDHDFMAYQYGAGDIGWDGPNVVSVSSGGSLTFYMTGSAIETYKAMRFSSVSAPGSADAGEFYFYKKSGVANLMAGMGEEDLEKFFRMDQQMRWDADQFLTPNSADWTVNANAPIATDSVNAGLTEAQFAEGTEQGVGIQARAPSWATRVTFHWVSRAQTAPGSTQGVQPTYYVRTIGDNAAVGAWSGATNFTAISIPTNANWQYDSQTITLATLGVTAGNEFQMEITRRGSQAGDTLTGNWNLLRLILEFS